ncbi:MAG: tetraacyldisaccharide 4'-kinase [Omnitrophica WOR_2 bacterium RBG_13_44_8b]|nr:MAG: tetraacyldisaccharide 4'-kinase [Omnitrophica WOR_2 bacterium RBG_13_44_8b]
MKDYLYNLATDKDMSLFGSCIKFFLLLVSLLYGLIVRILILFYRFYPYILKCTVISVGNITLGGTGKSSLVEFIARNLKQQGHTVAVLTRGYRRLTEQDNLKGAPHEEMGDEPYMLQEKLSGIPVIVDSDRIKAGIRAIRDYDADTVILDDGMQQWKIKKDLEIITINATCPLGNGHLLPRGILREPISSLRRADIFILTKTNLSPDNEKIKYFLNGLNPGALILESIHKPVALYKAAKPAEPLGLNFLEGKPVTLFCGIGDPDSFENLIKSIGANVGLCFKFTDHHNYTGTDLDGIIEASRKKNIRTVVTTEKDAARLDESELGRLGEEILVLRIEQSIKDEQRFFDRLFKLYRL